MTLAVVLLNWNQADDTIACAAAVAAWPTDKMIWVVDNASTGDDVQRIAQSCPDVRLIRSQANRGFAGGNNLALVQALEAGCDEVLLLNNDAHLDALDVEHLQQTLHAHSRLGLVGPLMWADTRPPRLVAAGGRDIARYVNSHILDPLPAGKVREVEYVPGMCILVSATAWREVGLLDEAYFFGGEIADWCARAQQHGFACAVDGGARATHRLGRSSEQRHNLHVYYVIRNRFLFSRKFHRACLIPLSAFWITYGAYIGLLAVLHREWPRARAIGLACIDGLRGRFGGQNARVTRGRVT